MDAAFFSSSGWGNGQKTARHEFQFHGTRTRWCPVSCALDFFPGLDNFRVGEELILGGFGERRFRFFACSRWTEDRPAYGPAMIFLASVCCAVGLAAAESQIEPEGVPIVCTQLPVTASDRSSDSRPGAAALAQQAFQFVGEGSRLIFITPGRNPQILTADFHSAADTDVSFDGKRIVFAAKPKAEVNWGIYELSFDGSRPRAIITGIGNCRMPSYQSQVFTLDAPKPWAQITFVSDASREQNEAGSGPVWELYSCRMDGSEVCRLTFTLSCCLDPWMVPDGRIIFTAWFRRHLFHGTLGKTYLMGINLDGTDYSGLR